MYTMKNKCYREQITEHDCGPTAFVNALIYLFNRDEIPAEVVRRVYEYTMDWPKSGSTSIVAMKMLANWLNLYKTKKFSISCEVIEGKDVIFKKKFLTQEDHSSCGILFVKFDRNHWHFITFLFEKDDFAYCFDPYPRLKLKSDSWEWMPEDSDGCNLKINLDYLNTKRSDKPFRAGKSEDRFFVLIKRRSKCKTRNRKQITRPQHNN